MRDIKNKTVIILIIVYLIVLVGSGFIILDKITGKASEGKVSLIVVAPPPEAIGPGKVEPEIEPVITPEEPISIEELLKKILKEEPRTKIIDLYTNGKDAEDVSIKDKVILIISSRLYHYIFVEEVNDEDITLHIYSPSPMVVKLRLKETKEVDLNYDGFNDISITLDDIVLDIAKITVMKLKGIDKIIEGDEAAKKIQTFWSVIIILSIAVIYLILWLLYMIKKRK